MSKYKSPFSVGQRKPIVISDADPRANQLNRFKSTAGAKVLIRESDQPVLLEDYTEPINYWISLYDINTRRNSTRKQVVNEQGDIYVAGYFGATAQGMILKYDKNRTLIWQKYFYASTTSQVYDISLDSMGNIYLVGNYYASGKYNTFLIKYDSDGNLIFQRTLAIQNTNITDSYPKISIDSTDNVYITTTYMTGTTYVVLAKYNTSGTMIWQKKIYSSVSCYYSAISFDSNNNIIMSLTHLSNLSNFSKGRFTLLKIDPDGNILLQTCFRNPNSSLGSSTRFMPLKLKCDTNNNVYVTMLSWQEAIGNDDHIQRPYLIKLDSSFNSIWQKAPADAGTTSWQSWAEGLEIDSNSDIYWGTYIGLIYGRLYKLSTTGSQIFTNSLTFSGSGLGGAALYGLYIDSNNTLYVNGSLVGSGFERIAYTLKIISNGTLTGTYAISHAAPGFVNPINLVYADQSASLKDIAYTTTTSELSITTGSIAETVGSFTSVSLTAVENGKTIP